MINNIGCITLDIKKLKNQKEIEAYILLHLEKYYPDPSLLSFDYFLTRNRNKQYALVVYTPTNYLEKNKNKIIEHPYLLFKYVLKKDGNYILFYKNKILQVIIQNKLIISVLEKFIEDIRIKNIENNSIIICDYINFENIKSRVNYSPILSDNLYKKCKHDIFIKKSQKKYYIYLVIPVLFFSILIAVYSYKIQKNRSILNDSIKNYQKLLVENEEKKEISITYNQLLNKIYIIQSQISPDLYTVLYYLEKYGKNFRIIDLNINNQSIVINAISTNSITLKDSLNHSKYFLLKQNSTVTKGLYEQINLDGKIICQ